MKINPLLLFIEKRISAILILLILFFDFHSPIFAEEKIMRPDFSDLGAAHAWFDVHGAEGPEGLWQFPEDGAIVAVVRDTHSSSYNIVVVETSDCRVKPGDIVGSVSPTASFDKFLLTLGRSFKGNLLSELTGCAATLNTRDHTLIIEKPKLKLSVRSTYFLPKFWRLLRLSVENPAGRLPVGIVRIYPAHLSRPKHIYY